MTQYFKEPKTKDNLATLLRQRGLVYDAPKIEQLASRVEKCAADGRPLRLLYGETFDERGNTIDSMKYYLFTSILAKQIASKYDIAVEPTILVADLGVFRNYSDHIDEMRGYAGDRVNFANMIKETYDCTFEVKLQSDIATTQEFKERLEKVIAISRADDALIQMIIESVPSDRREESAKNGYIYSLEEIATILGIDIKIGPPREKLYDVAANSMLSHFNVDPLLPTYLNSTYPLGMDFNSYINSPLAKYGLTPYKAGSVDMTDNRIVMGYTSNADIERLLSQTEIQPEISKPNPVLDVLVTADMARQHLQQAFDSNLATAVYKRFYNNKLDPDELKSRTYTELHEYVLSILPITRTAVINDNPSIDTEKRIRPWSDEAVTKQEHSSGFVISDIPQYLQVAEEIMRR